MTGPAAVISGDCTHENFTATAQVIRETDEDGGPVIAWSFELQAFCVECGAPMLWKGVGSGSQSIWDGRTARPRGNEPIQPLVSVDRTLISLPCEPHPPGVR